MNNHIPKIKLLHPLPPAVVIQPRQEEEVRPQQEEETQPRKKGEDNKLSNEDWGEFRKFLFQTTKEHDEETAFKEENQGIHEFTLMMLDIYDCGRNQMMPPQWKDAYETMKKRQRDQDFIEYMTMKKKVLEKQEHYEHLESVDLTKLTGGPMRNFLNKKRKKN